MTGWLLAALATAVYLLTMNRSVDWWDCGEFIATSYGLQVGHPPGAPLYQLLARCVMMLSFGNPLWVAPLGNGLSALCGGLTVMVLYRTCRELRLSPAGAAVGALCYLFCDTVWFSAVESEVYAMAMLFCSLDVWLALRWRRTADSRLPLLLAFLFGLGLCVHLMTLLALPAVLWIGFGGLKERHSKSKIQNSRFIISFFLLGLTPYAVLPIRSAAHPPIDQMEGDFAAYIKREQYDQAPLYPRLWRERDRENWAAWGVSDPESVPDNAKYYAAYQLGYMYLRYVMYNFIGRENLAYNPDREGFSPFNIRYPLFIVPFLLGLWGMVVLRRRRSGGGGRGAVLLLFLFGGVLLNFYLNHPCYEPRERDYAYVLSFYAFAVWIAAGADTAWRGGRWLRVLAVAAPLTLALGNWPDHDRSRNTLPRDIAAAHLDECAPDAILITYGDNDTYPLWYLQQVERMRPDVELLNINLTGYYEVRDLLAANDFRRPVYLTRYTYEALGAYFPGTGRRVGFCWRLFPCGEAFEAAEADALDFHNHLFTNQKGYIDPLSRAFLDAYRMWADEN